MKFYEGFFVAIAALSAFEITLAATTADIGNIKVRYGVLENVNNSLTTNLTLINLGLDDFDSGSLTVSVYVCFIRLVKLSNEENGVKVSQSPAVTVLHLDGCAHKIVYGPSFQIISGQSFSLTLSQDHWSVAYTDVMPNWYIQLGDGDYQLIENTNQDQTLFVDPFDTREKYLRSSADRVLPLTLEDRYLSQKKQSSHINRVVQTRLVPDVLPSLSIDEQTQYTSVYNSASIPIDYQVQSDLEEDQVALKITLDGNVAAGVLSDNTRSRGIAESTVKQLLERFSNKLPVGDFKTSAPRFKYRGHMMDIARHFHDKDVIKRQLDLMRRYKLNVLHLHLIDDESWGLEIDGIPELTQIGSKQCFNISECATYPQLGRKADNSKNYLAKAEYIEIVRYAESLGITVLPEVELPGHSTAAVNAMRIRYEQSPGETDYRLHDPEDKSVYTSVQYFQMGAMNPCVPTMYDFIEKVIRTIQDYHTEAGQRLKTIHLAGDEVAEGAWTDSPACARSLLNLTANATGKEKVNLVKISMMTQLGQLAERLNVSLAFWEDGLINKTSTKPFIRDAMFPDTVDVYAFIWQTVWEWWGGDRAFNMANDGYKVVMAPATRYYMDHPHEPHPNERGYYWATRYTDLKRVFSFRPENYYANIDGVKVFGDPITRQSFCNPDKCPDLLRKENIIGVEAPLFGETIFTQDHIDNNVWPRILAVAERGWNEGAWESLDGENPVGLQKDFDFFRQVLERYELPAIEQEHSVNYHLSPPGAIEENEGSNTLTLQLSVEFEGQRVWWRPDNSSQWIEAVNMAVEYTKGTSIYLRTSNAAGDRFSYKIPYTKDDRIPETTTDSRGDSSTGTLTRSMTTPMVLVDSATCLTYGVYYTTSDSCQKFAMSVGHSSSKKGVSQPCSPGTLFDLSICGCNFSSTVNINTCRSKNN